jgi:hypothetical protein
VPVWTTEGIIGVLGMAVEIAEFDFPKHDPDRLLVLLDLRKSLIDHVARDSLILHHPLMEKPVLAEVHDGALLARLEAIQTAPEDLLRQHHDAWSSDDYRDPIEPGRWRAAFAPVRVRRSTSDLKRETLPIIVIAQQRRS